MSENGSNNFNLQNGGERLARVEQKIEDMMHKIDDLRGALERLSLIMENKEENRAEKCESYRKGFWAEIDKIKEREASRNLDLQTFKTKVLTWAGIIGGGFALGVSILARLIK